MAEGSIDDVAARLQLWCRLTPRGLALVEFHSESARRQVIELLKTQLPKEDGPFHALWLSLAPQAIEIVQRLVAELSGLGQGVVSVNGFGPLFPPDRPPAELVSAFNFSRERLAAPPLKQIWWMPPHVVEAFRAGAPDLYSWFRGRWHLGQSLKPDTAPRLEPGLFEMESFGILAPPPPPERPKDARRRAEYLVEKFEQSIAKSEIPREQLERQLLRPAIAALFEIGDTSAAEELEERVTSAEVTEREPASRRFSRNLTETDHLGELEAAYLRDLDTQRRALGDSHPQTAQRLNALANLYTAQGRHDEAEALYRRTLAILESVLGTSHPQVAQALNNLAMLYAAQSRITEAQALYRRALDIFERSVGSEHPHARKVRTNLDELSQAQKSRG